MKLGKIEIQNFTAWLCHTETKKTRSIKYIVLLLTFALFQTVYADEHQKIGKASFCCIFQHYTKTMDMADSLVVDSTLAILEVGEGVSKFGDFSSYEGFKPASIMLNYDTNVDPRTDDCLTVLQNFPESGCQKIREGLLPNFYIYEERPSLDWKIDSGEEIILGYKCEKACANYGGRIWMVSFTDEIPSESGPWKLNGLPGLILKAETTDGVHRYVAQAIFNVPVQDILFYTHPKDVKIKRDKFIPLRNRLKTDKKWAQNAGYYLNQTDIRFIVSTTETNKQGLKPSLNINGIPLPRSGGFGRLFQPLELK